MRVGCIDILVSHLELIYTKVDLILEKDLKITRVLHVI